MELTLNDDELALRDGIRSVLTGRFGMERVRDGVTREMWRELGEAGVFSLAVDGFGNDAAVIVFEELGAAAVPGPLVATFLAVGVEPAGDILGLAPLRPVAGDQEQHARQLASQLG